MVSVYVKKNMGVKYQDDVQCKDGWTEFLRRNEILED